MQQVGVDQNREHAQGLVVLDEAHAAHVGGEVIDIIRVDKRLYAGILETKIRDDIFRTLTNLIPLVERLEIDRSNLVAFAQQVRSEMATDEASAACDYDQITTHWTSHCLEVQ